MEFCRLLQPSKIIFGCIFFYFEDKINIVSKKYLSLKAFSTFLFMAAFWARGMCLKQFIAQHLGTNLTSEIKWTLFRPLVFAPKVRNLEVQQCVL